MAKKYVRLHGIEMAKEYVRWGYRWFNEYRRWGIEMV